MGGDHAGSGLEVGAPEKRLSSHTAPLSVGPLRLPAPLPLTPQPARQRAGL